MHNLDSHTSKKYNQELESLKADLLAMGGLVEEQVMNAVNALLDADSELAENVRSTDHKVNQYELKLDQDCVTILAKRAPAAGDLRFVISVTKAVTDLERIGDEAAKIARQAIELVQTGAAPRGYVEIRHIGKLVSEMVHSALDAFARGDVDAAIRVAKSDAEVNREYGTAMRELATYMMEEPTKLTRILNVMWSLRALERIGDHARNLAEYVIYLSQGEDLRHKSIDEMKPRS